MKRMLILALAVSMAACVPEHAQQTKAPLPVSVHAVAKIASTPGTQAAQASRYTAVIAPREMLSLAFKVPGYVQELNPKTLDMGSRVEKGEVLVRLRDADYKSRLTQAKASLDEVNASLLLARRDQERNAKLVASGAIAHSEFDRIQEVLGVAQAKATQAQAAVDQAEINLRDTILASPMDGLVVRRDVERGTLVKEGAVAFVLADLSSVKAVFAMSDQEVARVKAGDSLNVTADAMSGRHFPGVVTAVSPSADTKSRAFNVEVTIPNHDLALKDGMIVSVSRDPATQGASVAAVPLDALASPGEDGHFVVHVLRTNEGKTYAMARTVTVGGVVGDMATVLDGLSPGDQVITRGTTLAEDGQEVRIIR